jgi:hypothetical protein
MVHSGFEASAVEEIFSSLRGVIAAARAALFGLDIQAPRGEAASTEEPGDRGVDAARELEEESGPTRGWSAPASPAALRVAFDYRGNVTLLLDDDSRVEGYVADLGPETLRLWRRGETSTVEVPRQRVKRVELTGRDTASGRSWQTWLKNQHVQESAASVHSA